MAEALASAEADITGVSASLDPGGAAVGEAVRAMGRNFWAYQFDFSDRGRRLDGKINARFTRKKRISALGFDRALNVAP